MTQAKHTPGPWKIVKDDYSPRISVSANGTFICHFTGLSGAHINANENARLIAASPDLLENLTFLVAAAQTEPGMSIYKAHIAKAVAAIAKAKGR